MFTPKIGGMIQFHEHIFQTGWFNHQLDEMYTAIARGGLFKDGVKRIKLEVARVDVDLVPQSYLPNDSTSDNS